MDFPLNQTFIFEALPPLWLLLILAFAAWQDIQTRTISNTLILLGLSGLIALQYLSQETQFTSLFIGFLVGLMLWKSKFIGGGDSKLLMLTSAAFYVSQRPLLYGFISLFGAAQALLWILLKKRSALPYAVAILLGTISFILFGIFSNGNYYIFGNGESPFV